MDLGTIIDAAVARDADALAFVDGDIRKSFAQWHDDICRVAGGLKEMGLSRGDHLVAIMANSYEMATLYWASQRLAATFTPFNWRAAADDMDYVLADAEAVPTVTPGWLGAEIVATTDSYPSRSPSSITSTLNVPVVSPGAMEICAAAAIAV